MKDYTFVFVLENSHSNGSALKMVNYKRQYWWAVCADVFHSPSVWNKRDTPRSWNGSIYLK